MKEHCQICEKEIPDGQDVCPDCVAEPADVKVTCPYCCGRMAEASMDEVGAALTALLGGALWLVIAGVMVFWLVPGALQHTKDPSWLIGALLAFISLFFAARLFNLPDTKKRWQCRQCGFGFERK